MSETMIDYIQTYLTLNADFAYNAIGAAGAVLILFGFYRTSLGRWTNKSLWYELDNVIGPTFMIIYALHHHTYISIVVNTVWIFVAFRGLIPFAERYGSKLRRRARIRARMSRLFHRA